MDFDLNREQKEFQKAVREFVKGEFKKDVIMELLEKHEYPEKIWKKAAELGFIGIHFPEEHSGFGTLKEPLTENLLMVMVSKTYPKSDELLRKFNNAIETIREKGIYNQILKKYNILN